MKESKAEEVKNESNRQSQVSIDIDNMIKEVEDGKQGGAKTEKQQSTEVLIEPPEDKSIEELEEEVNRLNTKPEPLIGKIMEKEASISFTDDKSASPKLHPKILPEVSNKTPDVKPSPTHFAKQTQKISKGATSAESNVAKTEDVKGSPPQRSYKSSSRVHSGHRTTTKKVFDMPNDVRQSQEYRSSSRNVRGTSIDSPRDFNDAPYL